MTKDEAKAVKVGDMIRFKKQDVTVTRITKTRPGNPAFWFDWRDHYTVISYTDAQVIKP